MNRKLAHAALCGRHPGEAERVAASLQCRRKQMFKSGRTGW
ncbi:hypothetical protein [Paenibacillus graminis]|nr:hypothetical protein [Paenibacillus graminis]MEC0171105.1 hypothetical protein [Paenibacillus graminis]